MILQVFGQGNKQTLNSQQARQEVNDVGQNRNYKFLPYAVPDVDNAFQQLGRLRLVQGQDLQHIRVLLPNCVDQPFWIQQSHDSNLNVV